MAETTEDENKQALMLLRTIGPNQLSPREIQRLLSIASIPSGLELASTTERIPESNVSSRIGSIEERMSSIENRLTAIEKALRINTVARGEALIQFRASILRIPEVKSIYYKETNDGYDFCILYQPKDDQLLTLQKIVQAEIELDRAYKDLFFDFNVNHVSDIDEAELEDWKQLYKID